jgi:tetratricopeptide (TPR) repeat protein
MNIPARGVASLMVSLILAGAGVSSQQGPPRPDDTRSSAVTSTTVPSLIFERQHLRVRFESDGTSTREMTMHIRANDDAGVRQAGQIPLMYAPSSDDLMISKLEVHKVDGRIITVGSDAVQDHAIQPGAQMPMFIDLRQKAVTVPALQPGDMVAITAVWTVARPFAGKHSWLEHSFIKHAVVDDERLELDVPATMEPLIRVLPGAPAEQNGGKGQLSGNRRVFLWQTRNTAPVADEENGESDEAVPADVRFTTFADWNAFAQWLGPLMRPAADESVRAKALEVTKGLTERSAKIAALYGYVSTQIRYVSLSFGLGRYRPHAPGDVLKNQYGDCKDKHALLAAMLDSVGIRAVPILVNTERSITEDFPAPTEFDHVVTAVPTGDGPANWTWLDTTAEVAPFGMLVAATRDRRALSLGGRELPQMVVTTPPDGPFPFTDSIEVTGVLNPLGVLVAKVRLQMRGDGELVLRGLARALPRESVKEFGENFAKGLGFDGDVSGFAFSDPLGTKDPFEVTFTVRKAGFLDWAAPSGKLQTLTGKLDTSALDSERTPLKKDRKVGSATAIHRRFSLELPPGYTVTAPVGIKAGKDTFQYSSAYTVNDGTVTVTRILTGQPRRLLAADSADYTRIARSINSDLAQSFAVHRETEIVPDIPGDMSARELYSAGYSAFGTKDYETAITIWKRASDKDPALSSTLNGLGFAYQRLKRYDESIAAFEKQRSLDPANKKINADLGFVYKEADRLEDAAKAYGRHLAAEPLDGPIHRTLGEIYAELDRDAEAIASFEKAVPLVKPDPWMQEKLGRSYLALKKNQQARTAFDQAITLSPTPAILTRVAWALANRGLDPGRVLSFSGRSSAAVRDTLKGLGAAAITAEHFDYMDRLAWNWDASGLVSWEKGDVDSALRYFRAAWRLGGHGEMALHLGRVYEKQNKLADAASAYLTARAMTRKPGAELLDRIKHFYPAGDMEALLAAARRVDVQQRSVLLPGTTAETGEGAFNAILDETGRVVDLVSLNGAKELLALEPVIRGVKLPVEVPGVDAMRFAARIRVRCAASACYANLQPARSIR